MGGGGKRGAGAKDCGWGGSGNGGGGAEALGGGASRIDGGFGGTLFCAWPTIESAAGLSPSPGTLPPLSDGEVADAAKEDESSSWYKGNLSVTFRRCFCNDVMLFRISIRTINLLRYKVQG